MIVHTLKMCTDDAGLEQSLVLFKVYFFKKFFQEPNHSIKRIGSRSELIFCQFWSGSKLFAT